MLTGAVESNFKLKTWLSTLTQKQQQQLYQYLAGVAEAKAVSDLDAYAGARGGLHLPVDNHRVDCIPAPPDSVDIPPVVLRSPVTVLAFMDQTLSMRAPSKVKRAG